MTLERIKAYTEEIGDCWEWTRSYKDKKTPVLNKDGSMKAVRREVYELTRNVKLGPNYVITQKCGNWKCVCPDHLKRVPKSEFMAQVGASYDRTMHRRTQVMVEWSKSQRKLTEKDVEEIRASSESCKKLSKVYGVSHSVIHDVKRYRRYAPPVAEVWKGLMR